MAMRKHWSDRPSGCIACGAGFRSALAEARHRHNFPAMCKRNKQFNAFMAEIAERKIGGTDGSQGSARAVEPAKAKEGCVQVS